MFRSSILQSTRLAVRTPFTRAPVATSARLLRPLTTSAVKWNTTPSGVPRSANPNADQQHLTSGAAQEVKAVISDLAGMIAGRSPTAGAGAVKGAPKPGEGARENVHAQGSMTEDWDLGDG
ncbi:hypothetical protein QFC21_004203 [Naganishia friedmannii]|uniref:Uncharacterized protein n=1 Tax=Naganishia friedmannii TaxID=89922 RepID=A0ACC2VJ62_9TREE|nr:hypothetical protein QFC21_004203 [Naganishia friedmannii]